MDNIKISVSFKIKGGIMYQEKDKDGDPLYYDINTMEFRNNKTKHTDVVKFKTPKCKPCIQTINMTEEAYRYMLDTPTSNMSANHWKRIPENQRITEHLKEIQHDLDAINFEFTVFED